MPNEEELETRELAKATFAGGCFWCMQPPYDRLEGVMAVVSGYTGGHQDEPTYEAVCAGGTGHTEAVQVLYDPETVAFDDLLEVFWLNVDPTDASGQFADRGSQYRTAIFVHDDAQRRAAEASRDRLAASGRLDGPIATEVVDAGVFWPAEEHHQDYDRKNPLHYRSYRAGSGRDRRLKELWSEEE